MPFCNSMIRIRIVITMLLTLFIACEMRNAPDVASGEPDPADVMRKVVETSLTLDLCRQKEHT